MNILILCGVCAQPWVDHRPMDKLTCSVGELCDPITTRERVVRDRTREVEIHQVRHPSLLDRLRGLFVSAGDGTESGAWGVPDSRPPGGFDGLATLCQIEAQTALTAQAWTGNVRDTPEDNLHAIIGVADSLGEEDITDLRRLAIDARRWRNWASNATGWDRVFKPRGTCPACARNGTLRVHTDHTAVCGGEDGCGEAWGEDSLGLLARHLESEGVNISPRKLRISVEDALARSICPLCVSRLQATTRNGRKCPNLSCASEWPALGTQHADDAVA